MPDDRAATPFPSMPLPTLEELQHWTGVIGRAQQMVLEHATVQAAQTAKPAAANPAMAGMARLLDAWNGPVRFDPAALADAQADLWRDSVAMWQRFLDPAPAPAPEGGAAKPDKRFAAPQWREHPLFDLIRQAYLIAGQSLVRQVEAIEGLGDRQRDQLRFAARAIVDAASPANFMLTNPQAIERMIETRGASFLSGLENLLGDMARGQLSHVAKGAFEVGRDVAATPGKVIYETPLFQLIHYAPTTATVQAVPLIIFPPWINRFYILDLGPKKSFVKWAVDQGLSVFMVSWRSADESLAGTTLDDYVAAQIDAIDRVRGLLDVEGVHAIGYCVAGTVLAATLALLAARGEAAKVASATFFTAQVDFERAGDLSLFVDDGVIDMASALSADGGYLDGRYMAATFNLLRGRDLIWSYVVDNYLLGEDYKAFDLLHWNGDTTNLPANWHAAYLRDFYRDNRLVKPGGITVMGEPIDLTRVATPTYVQAGREDHIAPPESVWKITDHFRGPLRFVLAGSGHIAGVVNPPAAGKYQYWTSDHPAESLDAFIAQAEETKGSWWHHWFDWITTRSGGVVPAKKARRPGKGALAAIEDAPGRYVRQR